MLHTIVKDHTLQIETKHGCEQRLYEVSYMN